VDSFSKVDFNDDDETIRSKFKKSFSVDRQIEGNGLIAILKYIVFEIFPDGFNVDRPEKYGGPVFYESFEQLEDDFTEGRMASVDLKPAVAEIIIKWVGPLRAKILDQQELLKQAYPDL
jgi:tyrosyl-tRNA synthetase